MLKITYLAVEYNFKSFSLNEYKPLLSEAVYNVKSDNNIFKRGESNDTTVTNRKVELSYRGYSEDVETFKELLENTIRIGTFTIQVDRVDLFNNGSFGGSHDVKCIGIGQVTRDDLYFNINFLVYKI